MKRITLIFYVLSLISCVSCSRSGSGILFDGAGMERWTARGHVEVKDSMLILSGEGAEAVLKKGAYGDFKVNMELRTVDKGKGCIAFHTDPELSKGYRVAINNDRDDMQWWRMTGSLLSVRNLTKSAVKDGEWFTMEISVWGREVTVSVNGRPVVEYTEPVYPYRLPANAGSVLSEGTFAIISQGQGAIEFRNIFVSVPGKGDPGPDTEAQLAGAIDEQEDYIIRLHQEDFPVLDYHVHLKGGLTKELAAQYSRRKGINYAIAPNCGIGFPITDDAGVVTFLDQMRSEPFILAMQGEGREWVDTFSPEVRAGFDFVFSDALTFTDSKGRRTRLWIPEETWIEDEEQQYMDMIVDKIVGVLQEPIDVYVNPCFLPAPMDKRYDELWTEARIDRFVDALAKSGKALEINELYQLPGKTIIMKAKAAGVKFTFGTNNVTPEVSDLSYALRMKRECGIEAADMYKPAVK